VYPWQKGHLDLFLQVRFKKNQEDYKTQKSNQNPNISLIIFLMKFPITPITEN